MTAGGARPAVIIDCGSQSGGPEAVFGLERIVDLREPVISTTVVVTHLHKDHFNGFMSLASVVGRRRPFRDVTLVQPRLPYQPDVAPFTMRLFAFQMHLGQVSGVPDLDFASSLRKACRGRLERDPKSAGETLTASGYSFDVLWPPAALTGSMRVKVHRAVAAFDQLASKDPMLRDALDRVRRSGLVEELEPSDSARGAMSSTNDLGIDDDGTDDDAVEVDEGMDGPSLHGVPEDRGRYRPDLKAEVIAAGKTFRDAANEMSLVFATPRRDFVSWGDVPTARARRIVDSNPSGTRDIPGRTIALAPHHGSHGRTPSFRDWQLCISQNGPGLYPNWHERSGDWPEFCMSTFEEGDIFLDERMT
jgi:hypothetical protein